MSSNDQSFGPPRGMRDFYPEDMTVRNALFKAWQTAATQFGFSHYDSCVVESLDLLKRKAGEEIVDQIYAFADKSGRELALRAEMTPTLARMVAAKQGSLAFPLKWFAMAQCFRYERMTRGRRREHYQWNLDIIGEESLSAEAEVLAAAIRALALLGLNPGDYFVHLNSRALLSDLLNKLGIPPSFHAASFLALDKRGKIEDAEIEKLLLTAGLDSKNVQAVFSLLGLSSLEDVAKAIGEPFPESYLKLTGLMANLQEYGVRDAVKFDISVIRGLSYYTGVVFEAFDANRKYRAIFGGGRYDNLLNDIGGNPATAVGLGFGDVVVADLLADLGKLQPGITLHGTAIGYMEEAQHAAAIKLATTMRNSGQSVDLGLKPERAKTFFSRAGRSAEDAIYIGPDDIAKGTVRVKNMATRAERPMQISSGITL